MSTVINEYSSVKTTTKPFFSGPANDLKSAAGVLLGAWAMRRFPKMAVVGLVGVGIFLGMTMKDAAQRKKRRANGEAELH